MTDMMKAFVMKKIGEVSFMDKSIPADPGGGMDLYTGFEDMGNILFVGSYKEIDIK